MIYNNSLHDPHAKVVSSHEKSRFTRRTQVEAESAAHCMREQSSSRLDPFIKATFTSTYEVGMTQDLFLSAICAAFGSRAKTGETAAEAAHKALWNPACRKRPAAMIRCSSVDDVQQAIRLAVRYEVPLSVLGGGRHWAGLAIAEDGLVLDMRPMSKVDVNRETLTVTLQGGCVINDVLLALPDDLTSVTGAVSSVGYTGLMLGGGYGPLNSRFGLVCDTLRSAQVVLADGRIITASTQENADMLWALRGGGGNYGVVTEVELSLFPVPLVQTATILFSETDAKDALRSVQQVIDTCPDSLSVLSGLVTLHDGQKGLFLQPLLSEGTEVGDRLFDHLCTLRGARVVGRRWSPYKDTFDREAEKAWSANENYKVSARFCEKLDDDVTDLLTRSAACAPTHGCVLLMHDFHGQASRIGLESAAYPLRRDHYLVEVIAGWDTSAEAGAAMKWFDEVLNDLSQLSLSGGYPNVLGPEERQRCYDFYGPSRGRLQAIKAKYDPENIFSSNVCAL